MFTLRDQVFPRESGSAQAVSVPAYQQQVGGVCDDVNTDDSRRARHVKTIHKQLVRARTTTAQRNALLHGQRQTNARSADALATFTALDPPKALRRTDRAVTAAWKRNLARQNDYAHRLDVAATRAQLEAAIKYLSSLRTPLVDDGVKMMSGLRRLGGANCDLRTPINTKTFPLPPLNRPVHVDRSTETAGGQAAGEVAGASASGTGSAGVTGASSPPKGGSTGTAGRPEAVGARARRAPPVAGRSRIGARPAAPEAPRVPAPGRAATPAGAARPPEAASRPRRPCCESRPPSASCRWPRPPPSRKRAASVER